MSGGNQPISRGTKRLRPCAIATNGTIEVAADSACQVAGSRRASLASIDGIPASAVTRNAPKNTIAPLSPPPMMCTVAHSANDHSIG